MKQARLRDLGQPLIAGPPGRTEEVLHLPTPSGDTLAVQPNVFHRVLDSVPVGGWQVVREPDGLVVLLSDVRADFSDEALVGSLRRELAAQDVVVPPVLVRRVEAIPRGATGKAPLIKSSPRHS